MDGIQSANLPMVFEVTALPTDPQPLPANKLYLLD